MCRDHGAIVSASEARHCRGRRSARDRPSQGARRVSSVADGRGWPAAETAALPEATPRGRAKLKPLLGLLPYIRRYPGMVAGACVALLVAALATLAVPLAVRRMIDFGFSAERIGLIDQYFTVMIGVVAALAGASALRYYFVTVLGERVVA